jgi:two-component sensor histidine kinase
MAPFVAKGRQNVRLDGRDIILTAPAAQSLAMALHELATNAAKYGALSKPSGALEVSWRSESREGARQLRLEWRESGGPAVGPPARRGFGTIMLKKIIPQELGGNADLNYELGGLVCTMLVSSQNFSEKEAAIDGRRGAQ